MAGHRNNQVQVAAAVLSALMAACASPGLPHATGGGAVEADRRTTGNLAVQVRWPERDLGPFRAQVIPGRTRCVRVQVLEASGVRVADTWVLRDDPTATPSASFTLRAGNGYRVAVDAYDAASPSMDVDPIATGTATNLPVVRARTTRVSVRLSALAAPAITELAPGSGAYGDTVVIRGRNFGASAGFPFAVSIGGVVAEASRESDTEIRARVPIGAVSGNVVVTVDGVPSESIAPFTILQGFDAEIIALDQSYGSNGLDAAITSGTTVSGVDVQIE